MEKHSFIPLWTIIIGIISFITCEKLTFDPAKFQQPICKAFISDTLIENPQLKDSTHFCKINTVVSFISSIEKRIG